METTRHGSCETARRRRLSGVGALTGAALAAALVALVLGPLPGSAIIVLALAAVAIQRTFRRRSSDDRDDPFVQDVKGFTLTSARGVDIPLFVEGWLPDEIHSHLRDIDSLPEVEEVRT